MSAGFAQCIQGSPIIGGRLPQIHVGDAIAWVMDPNLIEIYFDGVTPWSMAQNIVEETRRIIEDHKRAGPSA